MAQVLAKAFRRFQEEGGHFAQTMPGFQQACAAIKKALDPKGVIAPGRYGIN